MNKKQKIIVSVTGIFLVLLIVFSITYAYYLSNIIGNTKEKSILLETADLEITYDNESAMISVAALESGTVAGTKTFTVTNNGNGPVNNYVVYLEKVVNTLTRPQDLVYTIDCKEYDTTAFETDPTTATSTSCNSISEETQFPTETDSLITSNIGIGKTQQYTLTITYLEPYEDQTADQGRIISGRINIVAREDEMDTKATLLNTIMKDTRITKNEGTPSFTGVETAEVGMYSAPDDYGTSWYFRGAQSYNYVNFAGFTWRVVRINGDGSIRLILDGTLDKVYRKNDDGTTSTTPAGTTSAFKSSPYNDNAYVGYMFGTAGSTDYDTTHKNLNDSTIKDNIDLFYETYIESDTNNYHYEKYLADTLFCGDKTLASTSIGSSNTGKGFGTEKTYYAASERLYYSSGTTSITTAIPTLECTKGATNTYSRYTSKKDMSTETTKRVSVNNDLDYPIALLSADELVMAGAWGGSGTRTNSSYYLYDAYAKGTSHDYWWTMSPSYFFGAHAYEFLSIVPSDSLYFTDYTGTPYGSRPVINLKNNVVISEGNGTYSTPYVIKTD